MLKVIMTKGLPASGKSTWAKDRVKSIPNTFKRVNKDDLREMLDAGVYTQASEKIVLKVRDLIILESLKEGKHVIVDDTNLAPKHYTHIKQLVKGLATVEIKDFTDVPLETCIKRDLQRAKSVGEKVIRFWYDNYLKEKPEEYIEDKNLPHAIIVDVDGTLAKMNGRSPFDWNKVKEDSCKENIRSIVSNYNGKVLIFTGRDGICEQDTKEWLLDNGIFFDGFFIRPEGNTEKDSIIKRRLFEENVRGKYYIDYVLDDRDQVVEMWRNLGLTCLQVDYGNF